MKVNIRGINIVLIIVLISAIIVITPAAAKTWYVHNDDELGNALGYVLLEDGDTIYVYNGTYGRFSIERSDGIGNITVKGEGADVVTIDCGGGEIRIGDSYDANGAVLDGFKVINSGAGVMVGCFSGQAQNCIIRNCVFEGMTSNLEVNAGNTTLENNIFANASSQYYFVNLKGESCTIVNNTFVNFTGSLCVLYMRTEADFSTIDNNTFNDNAGSRAVTLREASNCTIANNTFINNNGDAIRIWKATATDNIITRNNITSNGGIIYLKDAGEGNKIYLNDFVDNTAGVTYSGTLPATIYWNFTEPIKYVWNGTTYTNNYLGNYWSDYTGSDDDGDGIWDVPYMVYGTDMDYWPLKAKFENYPSPTPSPTPTPTPTPGPGPVAVPEFSPLGLLALIGLLSVVLAVTTVCWKRE